MCVCAVEGVKDSWTATNQNKRVAVIVSSPQNDPSVWRNNVLWSLATQVLHYPYHPAAATDWCVFSLSPEWSSNPSSATPAQLHRSHSRDSQGAYNGFQSTHHLNYSLGHQKVKKTKQKTLKSRDAFVHSRSRKITIQSGFILCLWYSFPLFSR